MILTGKTGAAVMKEGDHGSELEKTSEPVSCRNHGPDRRRISRWRGTRGWELPGDDVETFRNKQCRALAA
jgi:hypothetical protein